MATQLAYNARGERVGMTPTRPETPRSWTYRFPIGRLLQRNDPDSGIWTWAYDAASARTTAQTDAKGQITEIQADEVGRTIRKTTYGPGGTNVTFSYSQQRSGYFNTGRMTTMSDAHGSEQYDYDTLAARCGKPACSTACPTPCSGATPPAASYTGLAWPDGDAFGTPAAPILYDAAGRMKNVPGFVTNASYDALGRFLQQRQQANGTTTFWEFDGVAACAGSRPPRPASPAG